MALALATHGESGVHMHVMAGEVQADQALEDHAVRWLCRRQEYKKTSSGAAIGYHVQHGAKSG
jgi:hypothetical protein